MTGITQSQNSNGTPSIGDESILLTAASIEALTQFLKLWQAASEYVDAFMKFRLTGVVDRDEAMRLFIALTRQEAETSAFVERLVHSIDVHINGQLNTE